MARFRCLVLVTALASLLCAQEQAKPKIPPPVKQDPVEVEPPEEDESLKPKEYSFSPLEAARDFRTGEYYYKKGNYKAAAGRFQDATMRDPNLADAFLWLGESREKLHDKKGAKAAYQKYLELKPDSKMAASIKKKLG